MPRHEGRWRSDFLLDRSESKDSRRRSGVEGTGPQSPAHLPEAGKPSYGPTPTHGGRSPAHSRTASTAGSARPDPPGCSQRCRAGPGALLEASLHPCPAAWPSRQSSHLPSPLPDGEGLFCGFVSVCVVESGGGWRDKQAFCPWFSKPLGRAGWCWSRSAGGPGSGDRSGTCGVTWQSRRCSVMGVRVLSSRALPRPGDGLQRIPRPALGSDHSPGRPVQQVLCEFCVETWVLFPRPWGGGQCEPVCLPA